MKERPILFSGPMVRAILEGRKTQTRRILRVQPDGSGLHDHTRLPMAIESTLQGWWGTADGTGETKEWKCPYGQPGDRLWVREAWGWSARVSTDGNDRRMREQDKTYLLYRATADHEAERWRPSIHMPRWACRIRMEVLSVRVDLLQDITEEDAIAEGVTLDFAHGTGCTCGEYRCRFGNLWESINGPDSWDANPWVWVVTFKKIN